MRSALGERLNCAQTARGLRPNCAEAAAATELRLDCVLTAPKLHSNCARGCVQTEFKRHAWGRSGRLQASLRLRSDCVKRQTR
eukprot:2504637-Lingulodinium_polyedra.AAC.1